MSGEDDTGAQRPHAATLSDRSAYELMARQAPVGIFYTDPQGHCQFVNDAWCELAGIAREQALQSGWANALHPDDRERVFSEWREFAEQGGSFLSEYRFLRPDGVVVWLLGQAVEVEHKTGYVGTVVDITARKATEAALEENRVALQRSEERWQLALEGSRDGVWDWNVLTGEDFFSKSWKALFGFEDHEVAHHVDEFVKRVHPDDLDGVWRDVERYFRRETPEYQREFRMLHRDGSVVWVLNRGVAVFDVDGKPVRMVGTIVDITEHKRSEAELSVAKEAAEVANRAKSAFLATMSHELRTPMTGVLAAAELLRASELNADQEEVLAMVLEGGRQMVDLVDDVLHLSRIEAGRIELEKASVAVREMIEATLRSLHAPARQRGFSMDFSVAEEVPEHVMMDRRRVSQVITNLVVNAIKYSGADAVEIAVSVTNDEANASRLHFEVKDGGVGIPESQLSTIFAPFEQADLHTARTNGGTGLGLHVARSLVNAMAGKLDVRSQVGSGSTFWFDLPFESASAPVDPTPEHSGDSSQLGLRVLIADDNSLNRRAIARLLKRWGCEVFEAANGQVALGVIEEAGVDVVLMDIDMPVMDGVTAAHQIRSKETGGARIPIVALTADAFFGSSGRATDSFDEVLSKPVDWSELNRMLQSFLSR